MTRQKSENPIVPEGVRKSAPIGRSGRGGKGVPVDEEGVQLGLPFTTADSPRGAAAKPREDRSSPPARRAVPKASGLTSPTRPATMETVVEYLDEALGHVARNKGAPGSDGRTIADVRADWPRLRGRLAHLLLGNRYTPGAARRVEIPKPGGKGVRALSIPNVEDRVVQEAVRLTLEPHFEPDFHPSSHGFRPKRSCHSALEEASLYVSQGHEWVVDIDLSKFFDRVHHQRLLARVSRKVDDRVLMRTLTRIMRSSVVLPDGVLVRSEEGVPQGGPLSPLLSNIVLDELDHELARRGHRFTRYADDVAIFVRSERAGERVMQSLTRFIERRMRLKVNTEKSAVRRPDNGNFLGFRMVRTSTGDVETHLSERSKKRAAARIVQLTPRNWGGSLRSCIARLDRYLQGWFGYFGVVSPSARPALRRLDGQLRRRLRAIQLKHWKRKRTIVRKLNRMKFSRRVAPAVYTGRRSWHKLALQPVVTYRLSLRWFKARGLTSLEERHVEKWLPMVVPERVRQVRLPWG